MPPTATARPIFPGDSSGYATFLKPSRKSLAFAGLAIGVYATALIATVPAAIVLPETRLVERYGGTLWRGQALLAGVRIDWRWRPLRSIGGLGFAADWRVSGGANALSGRGLLRAESIRIDDAVGRGDGALLAALAPDLPFICDVTYALEVGTVAIGVADVVILGTIRGDPGTCRAKAGGIATPIPPLIVSGERIAGNPHVSIAPLAQRRTRFVEATVAEGGRIDLVITPAGARALPFAAPDGGVTMSIEP